MSAFPQTNLCPCCSAYDFVVFSDTKGSKKDWEDKEKCVIFIIYYPKYVLKYPAYRCSSVQILFHPLFRHLSVSKPL